MKIRKGLILALGLLIASCNVINSTNSNIDLPNEYLDDKSFSTKLLNSSYIKDKLTNIISLSLIPAQNNESQKRIVREINFYSLEDQKNSNSYYKNLYDNVVNTTPSIHSSIIAMNQVIAKRSQSVVFDNFLNVVTPIREGKTNTYSTGFQFLPSVAVNQDGNFVVAWASSGQDGNAAGIYYQRYNSSGVTQDLEFRANTYTTLGQNEPSVAIDSTGNFVVTWMSNRQDGSLYGIYGQRYNSSGIAQGTEFQVNTYTTGQQYKPSTAMDSTGNFVVTWMSAYGQDGSEMGIYGRKYNAAGVVQTPEFKINTYTTSRQYQQSIAMDSDGDFVVVWSSRNQDGNLYGIHGQRFNSSAVPQGDEFQINTYTTGIQKDPSVSLDSLGNFVVTWQSRYQDGNGYGIYGQRYNNSGTPQGSEFQVNTYTTNSQDTPSVALDNDGDFVVTWQSLNQDGSNNGIYAQRYNNSGIAQGSEFKVNSYIANTQSNPVVAMDSLGNFVTGWHGEGLTDSYGVYIKRYDSSGTPR